MTRNETHNPALRNFLTSALFLAAALLIMFFRNPGIFTHPEPFWEDMAIFLGQEYSTGFPGTLLITHGAYIHLLPRLIAWAAMGCGLPYAIIVMNLIVLLIKACTFLLIFRSREITSELIRWALIAYLVLLPFPVEIYNNVTNLQWWLIYLMAIVILRRETSVRGLVLSCVILLLCGLTGMNSVLFALPCAFLSVMERTRGTIVKSCAVIACGIVQLCFMVSSPRVGEIAYSGELIDLIDQFVNRCIYHAFVNNYSESFLNFIVFLAWIALAALNLWHYRKKPAAWFIFLFSAVYFAAIYYNFLRRLTVFEGVFIYGFERERYFVYPRVLTCLLAVSSLDILIGRLLRGHAGRIQAAAGAAVSGALCLVLSPEYHVPFPFHNHWYEDVRKFEEAAPGETVHFRYETQCGCNTEGVCWICDLREKE